MKSYLNNGAEQSPNYFCEEPMSNNRKLGAFITTSSQEKAPIDETCDIEKMNIFHHNMSLFDYQYACLKCLLMSIVKLD